MSNNLQDDRIAAALLEENDTSSDDENFLPSSDDEADHISEASEVRSDTDVEDAENNLEPYLDGGSRKRRPKKAVYYNVYYNSTKSGVDVVDKLARTYDVTRNCKRWPLTVFFSMLNHAGINAFIVYILNNSIERKKTNLRKNFIKQLGLSLLEDHISKRKDNPHIPRNIRRRVHEMLHEEVPGPPPKQPRRSQRCSFCPRNKDRKTLNGCFKCNAAICKEHANLMCQNCTDLDNE
ncbi:hypothetical protein HW555_009226 [Spodoptera exigua]|uniref:PiggyBac transposable element-derived protein domain-containing protein n=1 Tax=Spodoptera exigua TaxID=7107 RepID=A0A835GDH2_SPOEX|nr:hypothetical protein HW555_009226 [Spodoptera exigua]